MLARSGRLGALHYADFSASNPILSSLLARGRIAALTGLLIAGLGIGASEAWTSEAPVGSAAWTAAPLHVLVYALALAILASGLWPRGSARPVGKDEEALAGLSHGLRTPLNAVIGFSELMLAEVHGPLGHPKYVDYAKHVSESGTLLAEVTEQILRAKETAATSSHTHRIG